jgi:hypothetical protein
MCVGGRSCVVIVGRRRVKGGLVGVRGLGRRRAVLPKVTATVSGTHNAVVRRRAVALRRCYATARLKAPKIKGQIDGVVHVSPRHGRPTRVDVAHAAVGLDSIKSCLISRVRMWRFPTTAAPEVPFTVEFARAKP